MHHIKHATGAALFCLLLITAWSLEAHACGGYPKPEPAPVVACAVC